MHHLFIGRKKELQMLNDLFKKKSASLVVIKGRRRIGKSRLAQEFAKKTSHFIFSGLPPIQGITAADQKEEFAKQIHRELKIPIPRAEDWGDLFWHIANHTQNQKTVIIFDEISWMGSKDPTFLAKLKTAWDLYFKNNPQLVLILCGSISSWIEKNILSSTGFLGRISLNITLEELPLNECNEFWNTQQDNVSDYEKLKVLSVTGGVPRYLEEILPTQSAETNIERLAFRKEGFLFDEFERIFSDLFSSRSALYKTIVLSLANGPCELKSIYKALNIEKNSHVSEYMEDLVTAGFISRDYTWHLKTGNDSKLSQFRLKDNYLRFYLKYIEPNKKKIARQGFKTISNWQSSMGLQFENLVLNNRKSIQKILKIEPNEIVNDNPFFQRKTTAHDGCQIDYLIQTKFSTLYLCEIKFSSQIITKSIIDEVKKKISNLSTSKHMSVRPVLIHVNGVDEQVANSDFFASIIDFKELLHTI